MPTCPAASGPRVSQRVRHWPDLLVLDEPTIGLDRYCASGMGSVPALARRGTAVGVSHVMGETDAAAICLLLRQGAAAGHNRTVYERKPVAHPGGSVSVHRPTHHHRARPASMLQNRSLRRGFSGSLPLITTSVAMILLVPS